LFFVSSWRGGGGPGSNRIVITPGQIDSIVAGFVRTWQRPPTEQELKALLDEHVREEIATREAMATGLDRDDTIIRRRLRQKLEFLAEDTVDATVPTEAELQAWLDAHPELFRREVRLALRQIFLSPDKRGASLAVDARVLREQLSSSDADMDIEALGDSLMLPHDVGLSSSSELARLFGEEFVDEVIKVELGRWAGPIRSGYGLHIVFVREREAGRVPALAEVRPQVEREFTADRRQRQLQAMYARLLDRYQVVIEKRSDVPQAAKGRSPQSQETRK
jgi:parvulin-like peptidyl-prolyl cis-trans isomerase-like protein